MLSIFSKKDLHPVGGKDNLFNNSPKVDATLCRYNPDHNRRRMTNAIAMKKIILLATCAASISAYALPTYEPFTEYSTQVTGNATNAIDLCNLSAFSISPTLATGDSWVSQNYSADDTATGQTVGLDILVTNLGTLSPFTYAALTASPISLPIGFPGLPASGQAITVVALNPAQHTTGTIIGNSAVLNFASDYTRPASGSKTLYVSYLISFARLGQLGAGNCGRYLSFLPSSYVTEPAAPFTTWASLYSTFPGTAQYAGHGLLESTATVAFIGALDSSLGKDFTTSSYTVAMPAAGTGTPTPGAPAFIVGSYTFNASGSDVATLWENPTASTFGLATPPASSDAHTMAFNLTDIAGIVLEDRPGSLATGGVPTNWMANLMVGTTWSFVTGGCEFTSQPGNVVVTPTSTTTLTATAVAAGANLNGQNVNYQWQKVISGTPTPVNPGVGGADGSATVSGQTSTTLMLAGVNAGDAGTYQLLATSQSTGFTMTSSTATVTVTDPGIVSQPQNTTGNAGGSATFTAKVLTSTSQLKYAWYYDGTTMLVGANGPTGNGSSTVTGAQGTNTANVPGTITVSMTLNNISCADDGTYTLVATNSASGTVTSTGATLAVQDPYISVQPPAIVEVSPETTGVIPVTAQGTGLAYAWQWINNIGPNGNNGEITGTTSPMLSISLAATSADAGTYSVVVSGTGCAGSVPSSSTIVYYDTPVGTASVSPATLTQQVGTHLAFVGTNTAGSGGLVHYQWQLNKGAGNVNLVNGTQSDGSWVTNATNTLTGPGSSALVLSNIQTTEAGTYTLIAYNAASTNTATAILTVSSGYLQLSPANLEVTRVGEGSQTLSGATGNTLYLDQFTTSGGYVSTIMVPDSGTASIIVPGGPPTTGLDDSYNESYLTLSSNNDYLNFIGYDWSYPYKGGSTVTVGSQGNFSDNRNIGAVNGLGYFVMAYGNSGIDSAGAGFVRAAYSTDGLVNFWVAGAAGSTSVKYVNANTPGSGYASGLGILGLSSAVNGPICVGLDQQSLVFSDNRRPVGTTTPSDSSITPAILGLNEFPGDAPTSGEGTTEIFSASMGISFPDDFAFSPDGNTVYVADDDFSTSQGGNGGIQRYDLVSGTWTYANYTLSDGTGIGTNGMRGLTVDFSANATWGAGVLNAVLYATTSEVVGNRLIKITDTGSGSASVLLDTAGPQQFFRGVRFGPASLPAAIANGGQPQGVSTFVGDPVTLTVTATGDAPISYQWYDNGVLMQNQTSSTLVVNTSQVGNSTYTVVVSNPITAPITSSQAVVSVTSGAAVLVEGPQSRIETVGDHTAFTVTVTGSPPFSYQWYSNNMLVVGSNANSYGLTNIVVTDSATYSVQYWNALSTMPYSSASATLQVTTSLQSLTPTNVVVARVGDGVQALSAATGNTLYLDQFETNGSGVYSNTIMIPDNAAAGGNLIVAGGAPFGKECAALTLSANNTFLNFAGFNTPYPAATFNTPAVFRSIAAVDAFGYFEVAQDNQTLYNNAGNESFNCAVSKDGYAEFWTTGAASSGSGLKYAPASAAGSGGGNVGIAGSAGGTVVVNIVNGNLVYSDNQASPNGIWAFLGEPIVGTTPTAIVSDAAGNPNDFAVSPDTTTYPPSTSTIYVGDSSTIANGGGIQRYDWNSSLVPPAYALTYTLGTGAGSTNGASGLVVDFSANATWGATASGAVIFATTAGASSNQLIKIIDTGAGSSVTVMEQANANELLRGVRFGPVTSGPIIATSPTAQSVAVGANAVFTVAAQNGPLTYHWQLNGQYLINGPSPAAGSTATISGALTPSLTVANVSGADDTGTYTVIVSNPFDSIPSSPAVLTVLLKISVQPPAVEYVAVGGTAIIPVTAIGGDTDAGLVYDWSGPCGSLLGPSADPCGGGATIAGGGSIAALTIANVTTADTGGYSVQVQSADGQTASSTPITQLTVVNPPQFNNGFITGLPSSPQLNFTGTINTTYTIWGSSSLLLTPVTSTWTKLTTGIFSGGVDTFAITPPTTYEFYVITQP